MQSQDQFPQIGIPYRFKNGQLYYEDGARLIVYDGNHVVKVVPPSERTLKLAKTIAVCAVGFFYAVATGVSASDILRSEPSINAALPALAGRAFCYLVVAVIVIVLFFRNFDKAVLNMKPSENLEVDAELLKKLHSVYKQGPHAASASYGKQKKTVSGVVVGFFVILGFCLLILLVPYLVARDFMRTYDLKNGDDSFKSGNAAAAEKAYRDAIQWTNPTPATVEHSIGLQTYSYVMDVTIVKERLALALASQGKNDEAKEFLKDAIISNVYWCEHPPRRHDSRTMTLLGYDPDDQARKIARLMGNYCSLLSASGESAEARAFAKECWLSVLASPSSTSRKRTLRRVETEALRGTVKSLKRRNIAPPESLSTKINEIKSNGAVPAEEVLPLLIDESVINSDSKTLDDSVITTNAGD